MPRHLLLALFLSGLFACEPPPAEEPAQTAPVEMPTAPAPAPVEATVPAGGPAAPPPPTGVAAHEGLAYAEGLELDLYLPEGRSDLGVVLMIHGGGWSGGDRFGFRAWCRGWALAGYACATIDYRLAPANPYPAAVEDVAAAVAWLREASADYGLDPLRILAMGYSAGGHLALMAGLDDDLLLAGAASMAGPTDLAMAMQMNPSGMVERFLQGADPHEASPLSLVTATDPPVLLLHGKEDSVVAVEQAEALYHALDDVRGDATLIVYGSAGHDFPFVEPTRQKASGDLLVFLKRVLGDPSLPPMVSPGP